MKTTFAFLFAAVAAALPGSAWAQVVTPTGITYTGSGVEDVFPDEIRLIDGSGLSEAIAPGGVNLLSITHSNAGAATAWVTDAPGGGNSDYYVSAPNAIVTFDIELGGDFTLTDFVSWGYGFGGLNGNAIKDVKLDFSTDGGATISSTDTITVPHNFGAPAIVPLNAPADANFVTMEILDNYFGGEAAGGDRVGLAEFRFLTGPIPEPSAILSVMVASLAAGFRRSRS